MRECRKGLMLPAILLVFGWHFSAGQATGAPQPNPGVHPVLEELDHAGVLASLGLPAQPSSATAGSLQDFILSALKNNPKLRSSYAEFLAVRESITQMESLPDPRVSFTEYLKPVETRLGPQQRSFSASQSFPWFGTLSGQGDVRREKAAAAKSLFFSTAYGVVSKFRMAYYDLNFLEQKIAITQQHLGLMTQWEDVARIRYSSGSGQYTDVIKAQVELGILADRLAELEDQRQPLAAELNALLNRPLQEAIVVADSPVIPAQATDLAELAEQMKAHNPLLIAWDHRAKEALDAERLAKKQGAPSFTLGLNYIMTGAASMDGVAGSGDDALMATVGFSLPIWRGKYNAASREALDRYAQALSSKQEAANGLGLALERAHYKYRDAARKSALYRTSLLPKGRQSLEAIRTAYEAGSSSFLDLVDAQRLVLEFELSLAQAETNLLVQESVIENLVAGMHAGENRMH